MIRIAIDGPGGAGKSSIAKAVAKKLGIIYVDTGALYRTIALNMLKKGISPKDTESVIAELPNFSLELQFIDGKQVILLDGEDITNASISDRAKKGVSFAFQQPVRFKGITVKDLITLAAGREISISEACEFLAEVGLCARDYVNREVNASLSGGELKRIEIALIIARATKLSVFDEPEAGIDLWSFNNLIKAFERMYSKTQGSIVIISHQERILNIADRIIVIADGKIKESGTKDQIMPSVLSGDATCQVLKETI